MLKWVCHWHWLAHACPINNDFFSWRLSVFAAVRLQFSPAIARSRFVFVFQKTISPIDIFFLQESAHGICITASVSTLELPLLKNVPVSFNLTNGINGTSDNTNSTSGTLYRCIIDVSGQVAAVRLNPLALSWTGNDPLVFTSWGPSHIDFQARQFCFHLCVVWRRFSFAIVTIVEFSDAVEIGPRSCYCSKLLVCPWSSIFECDHFATLAKRPKRHGCCKYSVFHFEPLLFVCLFVS